MNEKILVVGATGLLGTTLTSILKESGYKVIGHGNQQGADVCADLTDRALSKSFFKDMDCDLVINLSALTNVDRCKDSINEAYKLNTLIVENIALWVGENNKKLIQISSDQVYDGVGPHKESDVVITNAYAFSKYAGELAAQKCQSVILRTNFFGYSKKEGRSSFSDWLLKSFKNKNKIKLLTDVYFSPLEMTTLCEMIEVVIKKFSSGTYNLGSREGMSKRDFAHCLAKNFNLSTDNSQDAIQKDLELSAYRPSDMRMDVSHFEKTFNVKLPLLKNEIYKLRSNI